MAARAGPGAENGTDFKEWRPETLDKTHDVEIFEGVELKPCLAIQEYGK